MSLWWRQIIKVLPHVVLLKSFCSVGYSGIFLMSSQSLSDQDMSTTELHTVDLQWLQKVFRLSSWNIFLKYFWKYIKKKQKKARIKISHFVLTLCYGSKLWSDNQLHFRCVNNNSMDSGHCKRVNNVGLKHLDICFCKYFTRTQGVYIHMSTYRQIILFVSRKLHGASLSQHSQLWNKDTKIHLMFI